MLHRTMPLLAVALMLAATPLRAQEFAITVEGGKRDLKNVPVCVPISLSGKYARNRDATITLPSGHLLIGQLTAPGLMTESVPPTANGLIRRDLHFIMPEVAGAKRTVLQCTVIGNEAKPAFHWQNNRDGSTTLVWPGTGTVTGVARPMLRYMHAPYDNSSADKRNRSYKVFHHLYDPQGKRLVTNGGHTDPYTDEKKLYFPHHRGLMYAFNKISYDGVKQVDTWHAKPGDTHEEHEKTLIQEAGPVLGRHRVLIRWHGPKNDVFAMEERELTVYNVAGGTLVEFASQLRTTDGKVRLDGDPQHAGFQFRAANEVHEKSEKQTYFLRPDGKGALDETRNWDPKTKKGPVNLPWDAMCFILGGQRYTVAYLNSPANPKESRFSERDYGRFGCYFEYDLTKEHPLLVNYRVWLQDGEMTGAQVQGLYDAFASPPRAMVKK